MAAGFEETPASTQLEQGLAATMRTHSEVFAGVSAARAAEIIIRQLAVYSLLVTSGRVHQVQEVDRRGDNSAGSVEWVVYTSPEDDE
jgi:hypothetical protein